MTQVSLNYERKAHHIVEERRTTTAFMKTSHLGILGILSFLRIGLYAYWIYWFNTTILPAVFITEMSLFLATQIPLILIFVDLIIVLWFLKTGGGSWSTLMVGIIVSIAYSGLYLFTFSVVFSFSIITVSALQTVALFLIRPQEDVVSSFPRFLSES